MGWAAVYLGAGLLLLAGVLGLAGIPADELPQGPDFLIIRLVFGHSAVLVPTLIAFASLDIAAAVSFLKLRPWARSALEVISWLLIASLIGYAVVFTRSMNALLSDLPSDQPLVISRSQRAATTVAITVALIAPFGLAIAALRSRQVREAFYPRLGRGPSAGA